MDLYPISKYPDLLINTVGTRSYQSKSWNINRMKISLLPMFTPAIASLPGKIESYIPSTLFQLLLSSTYKLAIAISELRIIDWPMGLHSSPMGQVTALQ